MEVRDAAGVVIGHCRVSQDVLGVAVVGHEPARAVDVRTGSPIGRRDEFRLRDWVDGGRWWRVVEVAEGQDPSWLPGWVPA